MTQREEIAGAVARGWCHPDNAYKVMDEKLALAIIDEVLAALAQKEVQPDWLLKSTQDLAMSIAKRCYPEVPQFEVLDDLAGVISQLDNMMVGMVKKEAQQEPYGYCVYFPTEQRQEFCNDLDELCEDLTNLEHEITPLYAQPTRAVLEQALSMLEFFDSNGYRLEEYEQGRLDAAIAAIREQLGGTK